MILSQKKLFLLHNRWMEELLTMKLKKYIEVEIIHHATSAFKTDWYIQKADVNVHRR